MYESKTLFTTHSSRQTLVRVASGVAQWLERRSWPANFPYPALD